MAEDKASLARLVRPGKTARRAPAKRKKLMAMHAPGACATNARLTLARLFVPGKTSEITAIPDLLDQLGPGQAARRRAHR